MIGTNDILEYSRTATMSERADLARSLLFELMIDTEDPEAHSLLQEAFSHLDTAAMYIRGARE